MDASAGRDSWYKGHTYRTFWTIVIGFLLLGASICSVVDHEKELIGPIKGIGDTDSSYIGIFRTSTTNQDGDTTTNHINCDNVVENECSVQTKEFCQLNKVAVYFAFIFSGGTILAGALKMNSYVLFSLPLVATIFLYCIVAVFAAYVDDEDCILTADVYFQRTLVILCVLTGLGTVAWIRIWAYYWGFKLQGKFTEYYNRNKSVAQEAYEMLNP